ncbi:MAG: right-handed parallel beta-helix repeat-containing protein [Proteobacteria bacterium]|nr:right-handed parallel beta-helix repeat-containing protein [Pseudomonadota bacterium]
MSVLEGRFRFTGIAGLLSTSLLILSACGGGGSDAAPEATVADATVAMSETAAATVTPVTMARESVDAMSAAVAASAVAGAPRREIEAVTAAAPRATTAAAPTSTATAATRTTGKVYFIDSRIGRDTNTGTNFVGTGGTGPWKSLKKLSTLALQPGDTVKLACGAVWNETLKLTTSGVSGTPIIVSTYPAGCSNPPVIDGSTAVASTSWVKYSGNIYKAALASTPQLVMTGGASLPPAHFPNRGYNPAQPTSMYLTLAANSNTIALAGGGTGSNYIITGSDLKLPTGASIPVGTTVRIRTNSWTIDTSTVSAVGGTKLSLGIPTSYPLTAGWGYYFLGQLWMLDSPGEWFYDGNAKLLYAWMPDSQAPAGRVSTSQLATGIDVSNLKYVTISGVVVRNVSLGINARNTQGVTISASTVTNTAAKGIDASAAKSDVIASNVISLTGADAISSVDNTGTPSVGMQITGNQISGSGVVMNGDTVVSLPAQSYAAIRSGTQSIVSGNSVANSGSSGIVPMAGSTVSGNWVSGACSVVDDCGGIYTAGLNNNSKITGNVVQHSRGALDGKGPTLYYTQAQGIYLDESASGVTVSGNTVTDADNGVQIHVAANNTIANNNLYGNRNNQIWMQETSNNNNPNGDVYGNVVNGNLIAPTSATATGFMHTTTIKNTDAFAKYDYNVYFDRIYSRIGAESTPTTAPQFNLQQWKAAPTSTGAPRNEDVHGAGASQLPMASYQVTGSNIVPNGNFVNGTTGWATWAAANPAATMLRQSCTPGYCAQFAAGGASSSLFTGFFPIVQGQWYRLSVDVMTGTDGQKVPLYVRRSGGGTNGYESVASITMSITGTRTWTRYNFVFMGTETVNVNDPQTLDKGVRMDIEQIQPGQTVYMTNAEIVPITSMSSTTRSDLLLNAGFASAQIDCPVRATSPATCNNYVRLADNSPVTWPRTINALSSDIVYTRDPSLADTDGDGISDSQDLCPGTPAGTAVNASGCSLTQTP